LLEQKKESPANARERATSAHIRRPTANQSKLTDPSNRHSTRRWWWKHHWRSPRRGGTEGRAPRSLLSYL